MVHPEIEDLLGKHQRQWQKMKEWVEMNRGYMEMQLEGNLPASRRMQLEMVEKVLGQALATMNSLEKEHA